VAGLGNRRSLGGIIGSDAGSVYRGVHEEDDLSHYMGQSEFGGAPTEVGVQSLVGGTNPQSYYNQGPGGVMSLRPPSSGKPPGGPGNKRQSEYKRDTLSSKPDSGLPPRERPGARASTKDNKNYGSFLAGLGGGGDQPRPLPRN